MNTKQRLAKQYTLTYHVDDDPERCICGGLPIPIREVGVREMGYICPRCLTRVSSGKQWRNAVIAWNTAMKYAARRAATTPREGEE